MNSPTLSVLLFAVLRSLGFSRLAVELVPLTLSEFLRYLFVYALILSISCRYKKKYKCTQEDVKKIVKISLRNKSSRVRRSQKNPHSAEEERCQGEIDLDSLQKGNEGMVNKSRTE